MTTIPPVKDFRVDHVSFEDRHCNVTLFLVDGTEIGTGCYLVLDSDNRQSLTSEQFDRSRFDGFVFVPLEADEIHFNIVDNAEYDAVDLHEAILDDELVWHCPRPDYEELFDEPMRRYLLEQVHKLDLAHAGDFLKALNGS